MTGILPEATRTRVKKTGWNAPAHVWFSRRTLDDLRDRVRSTAFRDRGIYDPVTVMDVINDHARIIESGAAEENHMMFLWQLLNLETWLDALRDIRQAAIVSAPGAADGEQIVRHLVKAGVHHLIVHAEHEDVVEIMLHHLLQVGH